ncbi:hypothetical protein Aperf_G00000005329 [Anoplocephala perfoliata]
MRCQYIHAIELIERNINDNTLLGKHCKEQLLSGRNLAIKTLVTVLEGAISLPESQHYGYVLDGFPTYLAFEEQLELVKNLPMRPDYVVYIEVSAEDLRRRLDSQRIDPIDGTLYNFLNLEDPPGPFPKPMEVPGETPISIVSGEIVEEDEMMEETVPPELPVVAKPLSWHPEFPRPAKEVIDRLLIRPEDTKRELDKLFQLSKNVQKSLEEFFNEFPSTHVIRIDGNCPPTQMFYNLMVKVRALAVRPAIPPYAISLGGEEEEEEYEGEELITDEMAAKETTGDEEVKVEDDTAWEEAVTTLSVTRMPTEHSRWELSEWQHFCPVQLYNGILEYGKLQFACGFLGSLYFLSSRDALNSFIRNPRPYLDNYGQSQPKPIVRIAIMGFQRSGADTLSRLVADRYGAVLISLSEILKLELQAKRNEMLEKVGKAVESDIIEKLENQRRRELGEITTSLMEPITEHHPQVVEAVARAQKFASAQPFYLEPNRYTETLVTELERLENENRKIAPEKRKPLSWVIEGLPPLKETWGLLKKRTKEIYNQVNSVRQAYESLHKIERFIQHRKKSTRSTDEEEEAGEEEEEAADEGEEEESPKKELQVTEKPANPWAEEPDPRLVKAQENVEEAAIQVIPPDPMPNYVFKLKDELPDYALMIHRLYEDGFGPFDGLPSLFNAESMEVPAIEPILSSKISEVDIGKSKSTDGGTDDAVTEPPEDPPISRQTFFPMPQPGPEVDCVREQLVQYDSKWETVKENLSKSATAYRMPVRTMDLSINKDKSTDDLLEEIDREFKKLFTVYAKESSQDQLDEEFEAEIEGFAETGCLEENPALKGITSGEEMKEGEAEEETEGQEGTEASVEMEAVEEEHERETVEEMEDPSRALNRKLGVTSFYCPVAFHDLHILKPGDPELVAVYKGLIYYFGGEENMAKFMADPEKYVGGNSRPSLNIPPLRIIILGPTGSGKTLHGRQIAKQFDLVHVSFHQMLQDVMMSKLKSRIGPEYADDVEIPVKVMPNLEEAVKKAIENIQHPEAVVKEQAQEAVQKDEEDTIDLSQHEAAIRENLETGEPLPDESLDLLLPRLWNQEPYSSRGFVLEGFPRTAEEVTYFMQRNLFPDFVIILNAEAADLVPRLLPGRLAKWKAKMEKIAANKKITAEWKAEKKRRIREEMRKFILEEMNDKKNARLMRHSEENALTDMEKEDLEADEGEELDDEADISEILDERIPEDDEEESEDEVETEADAITRMKEEITERIESENGNVEDVMDSLVEAKIPQFSIQADDQLTRVRYRLVKKIRSYILNREAIFERVYPVTLEEAENLIASGFKHYSLFGRYCPVSWNRISMARLPPLNPLPILRYSRIDPKLIEPQIGDDMAPDVIKKQSKSENEFIQTCAAVYRECVYWFNSEVERKAFSANPMSFIRAAGDQARTLRHQPLMVSVIGGPTTERDCICKQLSKILRVPYVTTTMALQWFLSSISHSFSDLANKVRKTIMSGDAVPENLVIKVLMVALLAPQVQARGYILDNYPITAEQAKHLTASSNKPILILELHNEQCRHPAIEMSWFENWNNQEPPDCPFIKVWLNMRNRQARGAGAEGLRGPDVPTGFGGPSGGAMGFEGTGGIPDVSRGPSGPGMGEAGGPGREAADIMGVDERDGGRLGIDERDGSGGGRIRGGMRADGAYDDEYAEGGGRGRQDHEGRDGEENELAGISGFGRGANGGQEDGAGSRSGRGGRSDGHSERGAVSSGRPRESVSGADDADGGRRLRRGRSGVDAGGSEDSQRRKGRRGGEDGLDESEYDEFGNKIKGTRSGRGKRGEEAEGKDGLDFESSQVGMVEGRRGGRKRHGPDDEYSRSSSSTDGSRRRSRRRRGHRRHRDSEASSSDTDGHGKRRRRHHGSSESSYDESDSGTGRRRRRRGHKEILEGEEGVDASRRARRRRRKGSQGSESEVEGGLGRVGGQRDGEDSETSEERKRKRYRKIEEPLKDRYGIPEIVTDDLPNEILKHFAYVDAEEERRKWLEAYNGLLVDVPAKDNLKVISPKQFLLILTHRMAHFMEYAANKRQHEPMSIAEMGMSMEQFENQAGEYGHYCPVRMQENDELFDCREEQTAPLVTRLPGAESALPNASYLSALESTLKRYEPDITKAHLHPHIPTKLRFAAEYKGKTYRMAGPEELEKFLKNPDNYLPPIVSKKLPNERDLPKRLPEGSLSRDSFPRQLALRGFCGVCYQESGQRYEGLKLGKKDILAGYKDNIYAFCSEECRMKFMHWPFQYSELKLPSKLPPVKKPIIVDELPLPGYLEQTVACVLRNALAMCSKFRPKYPFISPERSALIYLALQLKALNPRTPDHLRHRAKRRVEHFEQSCNLIDQLVKSMPLNYIAERQRSETLSKQLEEFLSLQKQADNEDRWIYSL